MRAEIDCQAALCNPHCPRIRRVDDRACPAHQAASKFSSSASCNLFAEHAEVANGLAILMPPTVPAAEH